MKKVLVYSIIILLSCVANAQNKSTRAKIKQMLQNSKEVWEAVKDTTIDDESIATISISGSGHIVVNGNYSNPFPGPGEKFSSNKQKVLEGIEEAWKLNPSYVLLQWDKKCPNNVLEFVVDQISDYMERCLPKRIAFGKYEFEERHKAYHNWLIKENQKRSFWGGKLESCPTCGKIIK